MSNLTNEHQSALSRLELQELGLLNWGAVDGSFSEKEAIDVIAGTPDLTLVPKDIFRTLCDSQLLVRVGDVLPKRYRTRFAETIRLMLKLRQLRRNTPWTDGKHLVADARIVHRARQFPRRDISPEKVRQCLADNHIDDDLIETVDTVLANKQLADFQLEATVGILKSLSTSQNAGFVVSAATSGGKSLAFYLPVLSWVADNALIGDHWVKAIALYPRNELLKDQLSSAYATSRLLDSRQQKMGRRPITVGAYFGSVPNSTASFKRQGDFSIKQWKATNLGFTCPFIRCPKCDGSVRWLKTDIAANKEVLNCESTQCGYVTPPDTLRLTRDSLNSNPPDILLTTTEMMNRHMSNAEHWGLFGIRTRPPRVMLLDEIHTNEGSSGANAAILIRRWRHLTNASPIVFVGLSATLADPRTFFSVLTGLTENQVISVEPQPQNIDSRGAEYMIALRSDPTTGVSPLSTTIQTIMLMRRMLDAKNIISDGVIGQRLFAFTDKLDVLNRLYDDFRDAEGRDNYKSRNYNPMALATLRRPNPNTQNFRQRDGAGQIWWSPQAIGHNLIGDEQLTVGRTASQDPGVDDRDVIIATASLEVGFNDPTVGAVVQHKAPNGAATFLQRKGRAGRTDVMRPYTVVVLSDFGRDRIAYLSYDQLFSPVVKTVNLPIKNRYVLRMQATYALIDWIAKSITVPGNRMGAAWRYLATKENFDGNRRAALDLVSRVLEGGYERQNLKYFLMNSLGIDDSEVEALFWQAPRSILLHVLPTLHKQLTSWVEPGLPDVKGENQKPLRDFIPQAMFGDLLVPEVDIEVPSSNNVGQPTSETLGISMALREFTPGRFNRRYGKNYGQESHWIPVPTSGGDVRLQLPGIQYDGDWLPSATFIDGGVPVKVPVFRPTGMRLVKTQGLAGATNASPKWHAQMVGAASTDLELVNSPWVNSLIKSIDAFCHALGGSLEVRRFMTESNGILVSTIGQKTPFSATFEDAKNEKCALGFSLDVDGLKIDLQEWAPELSLTPEVQPAMLASWFAYLLENSSHLNEYSVWSRNWIRVVALGAMARTTHVQSMDAAWKEVMQDPDRSLIREVAQDILGDLPTEPLPQVLSDVLDAFNDMNVLVAIQTAIEKVNLGDTDFLRFVRSRYLSTVAGAFVEAMLRQMPSMTADDIVVDVNAFDGEEEDFSFWVSESEAGSSGIIEGFLNIYQCDPQHFWSAFERALDPTDLETLDTRVADSLQLALTDVEIRDAFANVRDSMMLSLEEYKTAITEVFDLLDQRNVLVHHSVAVALGNRLLSAGTTPSHDSVRKQLRDDWIAEEVRLGLEIDMRSIAAKWSRLNTHDGLIGGSNIQSCTRHGFFESLLWPRGGLVRELELELPNIFSTPARPDRMLVPIPQSSALHFSVGRSVIDAQLVKDGEVTLWATISERVGLSDLMKDLAVTPVDAGYLNVHPRLTSFMNRGNRFECRLELVEVI
jgi:hypothetical protein